MAAPLSQDDINRLLSQLNQATSTFAHIGDVFRSGLGSAEKGAKKTSESFVAMGASFYEVKNRIDSLNSRNTTHIDILQKQLLTINEVSTAEQNRLKILGDLPGATQLATDTEKALIQQRKDITRESIKQIAAAATGGRATKGISSVFESLDKFKGTAKGTVAAIQTMAPALLKAGVSMATLAKFTTPVGWGISLLGLIIGQLTDRFNEARKISLSFGGQIAGSKDIIQTMTGVLISNQATMKLLNVTAEEFGSTLANLSKAYAFSKSSAANFGQSQLEYVKNSSHAIISTIGMARTTGMANKQIDDLLSSFSILGENMAGSSESFLRLAARSKDADISIEDMSQALIQSAPAHVFVADAVNITTGVLSNFAKSIVTSNAALFDGANKSYIAAKAVHALADAANSMDLPQMLAFGAAMTGMTGTIDDMLVSVSKTDRFKMMGTALDAITKNVQPGQQLMARTVALQQMFHVADPMTAIAMASMPTKELLKTQIRSADETKKMIDTGGDMYRLSVLQSNTIDKIYAAITSGLIGAAWHPIDTMRYGWNALRNSADVGSVSANPNMTTNPRTGQSAAPDGTQ